MQEDLIQFQTDKDVLESAKNRYTKASQENEKMNVEHRDLTSKYMDGILFYSAGAFSFTVALIGLIDSNRINALSHIGIIFPNIYWLYICWISFILACVSVILSRKFNAYYSMFFGMSHYTGAYRELEGAQLNFIQKHPENIIFADESQDEHEKKLQSHIDTLDKFTNKHKRDEKLWYTLMRTANRLAEFCAFIGVTSLILFSIQLSQAIIWR